MCTFKMTCHNNSDICWSNAWKCVSWSLLLGKFQIIIWNFLKGKLLLCHIASRRTQTTLARRYSNAMLGVSWARLYSVFAYAMIVPRALRQHGIGFFYMQCCLEPQRQHYIRFLFFLCRIYSWDNIARIKTLCSVFQEAPYNIAQAKTLCNVLLEALDDNAQENVLFNVVLKISLDNNAQVKTLYNVLQDAPDNIA